MRKSGIVGLIGVALLVSSCCKERKEGTPSGPGAAPPPSGVFVLTGVRAVPPNQPSAAGWEVKHEDGWVEYSPRHDTPGNPGWMKLRFEWTNPPKRIAPGELWPITATAKIVASHNPLSWSGAVDARDPGGSLFPLNSLGGSQVSVGSPSPAGHFVTLAATRKCAGGGADFDLHISSPTGNKDWSVDYYYHYKWTP